MSCQLLLVDDEPNVPKSIRRALRQEGYQFHIANSGAQALDLLKNQSIDVILSDHRMPGMTGSELLTQVTQLYPDIVNVMLSGQADMSAVIDAVNDGNIYKFLHKPWSNDALRSTVAEAADIAKQRQLSGKADIQSEHQFCLSIPAELHKDPMYLVLLEIRNASELRTQSDFEQVQAALISILEKCCDANLGKALVPLQLLEGNLFAGVHPQFDAAETEALFLELGQQLTTFEHLRPTLAIGYAGLSNNTDKSFKDALNALTASLPGQATKFSESIGKRIHLRQSLESDMRLALPRNEFFLELQPQVACRDNTIRGVESLCRWIHPTQGKISPEVFIDLAEQTGFINRLGLWVVQQGCDTLKMLRDQGIRDVRLSVNVSPRQFSQRTWVSSVLAFLESQEINPHDLELEITESSIMENASHALKIISELRERGVRIAMDDFGTGHSSLGQINQLPIDVLKLDRSLIVDVETNERSRSLLKNMLSLAHDLGMETIAEGVETAAQVELCTQYGCDLIQGYFFYKPMAIEAFTEIYPQTRL